jgi:hypothetical protein
VVPRSNLKIALFAVTLLVLAGCGDRRPLGPGDGSHSQAENGYLSPPQLIQAAPSTGQIVLRGRAAPHAKVTLGQVRETAADSKGAFAFAVPLTPAAQIFSLSMMAGGRRVQAEGYVLVTAKGQVAVLKSGAAAERLDMADRYGVGAFDFDSAGAAIVAGRAPAGSGLSIRLDGRQAVEARSDDRGAYIISLPTLRPGPHRIEVVGDNFTQTIDVAMSPAEPLTDAPIRTTPGPGGLRVDWMTPGGGLQSTIIAD